MQGPRERMVVSAALLIRERGAHATAISDVLQHSGAPRGSASGRESSSASSWAGGWLCSPSGMARSLHPKRGGRMAG